MPVNVAVKNFYNLAMLSRYDYYAAGFICWLCCLYGFAGYTG
jgi:hypothetical protein